MDINTKAQDLVKVTSAILDLVGSNQFSFYWKHTSYFPLATKDVYISIL